MKINKIQYHYSLSLLLVLPLVLTSCATRGDTEQTPTLSPKVIKIDLPNMPEDAEPLVLVELPAGSFLMGSPEDEVGHSENESPVHEVILTQNFYFGKFEVTQAQWMALMDKNPSTQFGNDLPVNRVNWEDCQEYIKRLNEYCGDTRFRLPTEAELEYARRAGRQTSSYLGDNVSPEIWEEHAWFRNNSDAELHPVGSLKPNPWGLYDLYGNVWEWCQDWYGPYPEETVIDPVGPETGEERAFRGPSWMGRPEYLRAADRGKFPPDYRRHTGGFRVARSI